VASSDPYQVHPSARWYAAVVVAWIVAAVCMFFAIKPLIDVLDVTPIPIDNRTTLGISGDGLTVYATGGVVGGALCSLTDENGNVYTLEGVTDTSTFEVTAADGSTMHPIATTPKDLVPGTYTLRCAGVGATLLGFGDRINYDAVLLQIGGMFILAGLFGVAGLVVLIVVLVRRHNSKRRLRWAQAAYAGWGQWYASPYAGYPGPSAGYPGYPQQGYPQTGYPQATYPPPDGSSGQPYGGYGTPSGQGDGQIPNQGQDPPPSERPPEER
jgi:hypothetical protein